MHFRMVKRLSLDLFGKDYVRRNHDNGDSKLERNDRHLNRSTNPTLSTSAFRAKQRPEQVR